MSFSRSEKKWYVIGGPFDEEADAIEGAILLDEKLNVQTTVTEGKLFGTALEFC
jgi:hypothetical protein